MSGVRRPVAAVVAMFLAVPFAFGAAATVRADGANCATGTSPLELSEFFGAGGSGLVGGDYPHAYPLPDGRVLWLFQDSFLGAADTGRLYQAGFAHNAALIQTGNCFELRWGGGPVEAPQSFLGGALEGDLFHWWWPLDGEIGVDGNLHVFAAEFQNPAGTGANAGAEPVAVWQAVIRVADLAVLSFDLAPDSQPLPLYGFSVVSDDTWSYLYGNCYRQFTGPQIPGWFDLSCTTQVMVGRVPKGHFEEPPTYWNGADWVSDRSAAVAVHQDGILANPLQVDRLPDGRFVAVSHLDDWFGHAVTAYTAGAATGPFQRYAEVPVSTACDADCTTYFAGFTPWRTESGSFEIAISNFTWDFGRALVQPWLYRPSVVRVPSPDEPVDTAAFTIDAEGTVALALAGRNGVDPAASTVSFTLVAANAAANGYVTVWPCGTPRPVASSLNLSPGSTVGNTVIAPLGGDGRVCLWSSAAADLLVDVQGWTTTRSDYHRIAPSRLLDTRPGYATVDGAMAGGGIVQPGAVVEVPVAGRGGVSAASRQVAVNITAAGATSAGYVTAWDCGARPATSNLNVVIGQAASNLAVVGSSPTGTICVTASVRTHLLIDAQGWWGQRGEVAPVAPARLLDTRPGSVTVDGIGQVGRPLALGEVLYVPVAGRAGVGRGEAVVLDVVALRANRAGYLTVWPCSSPQPLTSNVNFQAGAARATVAITAMGRDGWVCVSAGGADRVDVVIDVTGWFPAVGGGYVPLVPSRALDTRNR